MSAPQEERKPRADDIGTPRPGRNSPDLVSVRSRDVRALRSFDPPRLPGPPPAEHGGKHDPRYPSSRRLRRVMSCTADLVLHVGTGIALAVLVQRGGGSSTAVFWAALGGFVGASIVHRMFLQALFRGRTLGKALTGLRRIREHDGGDPRLGQLVAEWFLVVGGLISLLGN